MTKGERLKAVEMRCDGATWEDVSKVLGYEPRSIQADLIRLMQKRPSFPKIIYPAADALVRERYGGSIQAFADDLGVSQAWLRKVLVHGEPPGERLLAKIEAGSPLRRSDFGC